MSRPADDPRLSFDDFIAAGARAAATAPGPRIRTVAEVTRLIKDTLRAESGLRDLWVEGEVGQVSVSSAGHCYFTLKDERTQLKCMVFRDDRMVIPFEPRTGLRLVAHGRLDVFDGQGVYQLYVDTLQPAGFGDLALRFEALKARLTAEGLFDARRKRPLPEWPRTVGLATSISGAVLHDMRRVLARRWPLARVVLAACSVQGPGAAPGIVAALRRLGRWRDPATRRAVDVVILARGGGSLEDLWAFNDEAVVRAVAAMPMPVVVGVGHETDVTLAEFAADIRAATPSVAAELVVPARVDQAAHLSVLSGRMTTAMRRTMTLPRETLAAERRALESFRPGAMLAGERERVGLLLDRATRALIGRLSADRTRLDVLDRAERAIVGRVAADRARLARGEDRLPLLVGGRLARSRTALGRAAAGLHALSPFATLERGYAIVRGPDGEVVREATSRRPGDALVVTVARGELDARVEAVRDSGG
jgi:exodeoxyribonuclease VII large subunit